MQRLLEARPADRAGVVRATGASDPGSSREFPNPTAYFRAASALANARSFRRSAAHLISYQSRSNSYAPSRSGVAAATSRSAALGLASALAIRPRSARLRASLSLTSLNNLTAAHTPARRLRKRRPTPESGYQDDLFWHRRPTAILNHSMNVLVSISAYQRGNASIG